MPQGERGSYFYRLESPSPWPNQPIGCGPKKNTLSTDNPSANRSIALSHLIRNWDYTHSQRAKFPNSCNPRLLGDTSPSHLRQRMQETERNGALRCSTAGITCFSTQRILAQFFIIDLFWSFLTYCSRFTVIHGPQMYSY